MRLTRSATPAPLKRIGRQASRAVGRASYALRPLPDFLIVGGQRCGTTSMFHVLRGHPDVVAPVFHKGVHYFDVNFHRGEAWYRGHFPVRSDVRRTLAFESSPYYMHHPSAPSRIATALPGVRLIVMLRDPVERAYSAYEHEFARGFETEPFERALDLEPERLAGEAARMLADPTYQSHSHRHHGYATRGEYADQLARLFELFGRDRVLVLESDRFFEQPAAELPKVLDFLGLDPWRPSSFEQHNARPRPPMPAYLRDRLDERFGPHDEMLGQLLGESPRWRR